MNECISDFHKKNIFIIIVLNKYFINLNVTVFFLTINRADAAKPTKKSDDELPAEYLASPLSKQQQVYILLLKSSTTNGMKPTYFI